MVNSKIVNQYPRNRKTVLPLNYTSANLNAGDYFDYTIQFQNTGDVSAEKAWIIDTLDARFDMSTLYVVGASHAYSLTIVGNALRVDFDNINIPHQAAGEVLSHGFFRFKIKPYANLQFTGTIRNKAYIYFSNGVKEELGCGTNVCFSTLNIATSDGYITTSDCYATMPGYGNVTAYSNVNMYDYVWSNGDFGSSQLVVYTAGTYYVTATDVCGSTAIGEVLITEVHNTDFQGKIDILEGQCGIVGDSLSMTTCSAAEPITYLWNNGSTAQAIVAEDGVFYTCTATDANGATVEGSWLYAGNNDNVPIEATVTNDPCTGTATISASGGGDGWYMYQWSNGATDFYITDDPGSYTFTVTNVTGCTDTGSVMLLGPQLLSQSVIYPVSASCGGDGTGEIYYDLWVGVGAYMSGSADLLSGSGTLYNLPPGDYSFYVHFADGATCAEERIVTIVPAQTFPVTVTEVAQASCTANNGKLVLSVDGATDAGVTYTVLWSNGWTNVLNENLAAGTYNVTVTFSNNCSATASGTVNPQVTNTHITKTIQHVVCRGASTGSVSISPYGGSFSYSYLWSNGETTQTVSQLSAGTYYFTVTDQYGCPYIDNVIITQPAQLYLSVNETNALCTGGATGALNAVAIGGTPPYTYSYPGGIDPTAVAPGIYTVWVTDACNAQASYTAIVNTDYQSALSATVTSSDVLCHNGADGEAYIGACGGQGSYTYTWSNGAQGENVSGLAAGTYTVTISDGSSSIQKTVVIGQPTAISFSISTDCSNVNSSASIEDLVGGSGSYSYEWSNGSMAPVLANVANGSYSVTVSDASGCTASSSVSVTSIANLAYPSINVEEGNCTAPSTVTVNGTTAGAVATFNGNNVSAQGSTFSVQPGSTYILSVAYTSSLCYKDTTIHIPAAADTLKLSLNTVANPACHGEASGSIAVGATGGTSPYTYTWSNGSTSSNVNNVPVGDIVCTVTDALGCEATDTFTLVQPTALSLTATSTDATCYGTATGLIQLTVTGGTGNYTYQWNVPDVGNGPLPAGTYSATVTDANGCTISTTQTITEPNLLAGTTIATDESVCGAADGAIEASITGGTGPYTYEWSNGQTTAAATSLTADLYTVTITDANGCVSTLGNTVSCITSIGNANLAQISIYPNPATNLLYVNVPVGNNYTISIHDVAGRLIKEQNLTQQLTELYLGDIVQGMYTVEVKTQQGITKVERLVVR
jgi:uncharacterized repeat protein (TIGR01451 family)